MGNVSKTATCKCFIWEHVGLSVVFVLIKVVDLCV